MFKVEVSCSEPFFTEVWAVNATTEEDARRKAATTVFSRLPAEQQRALPVEIHTRILGISDAV